MNEFEQSELLSYSYITLDTFERHIMEHQALKKEPLLFKKAQEISRQLGEFYQEIGNCDGKSK